MGKCVKQYKSSSSIELLTECVPCCLFLAIWGLQVWSGNWATLGYFSRVVGTTSEESGPTASGARGGEAMCRCRGYTFICNSVQRTKKRKKEKNIVLKSTKYVYIHMRTVWYNFTSYAIELKLLYTGEVKESSSDTWQICSKYIQTCWSSYLAIKNI